MGAFDDVEKAKASRNIRRGKGKMRNRRYVSRKGPLVVLGPNDESGKAFRNLPGVEVAHVDRLNLLQARRRSANLHDLPMLRLVCLRRCRFRVRGDTSCLVAEPCVINENLVSPRLSAILVVAARMSSGSSP